MTDSITVVSSALRREETITIDLSDVDTNLRRVWIRGKGRTEDELITLPSATCDAIDRWVVIRGPLPGGLLTNFDHAGKGAGRLSKRSIWRIVGEVSERAGVGHVRPHALRHAAITQALDATGGDVRRVQKFSRHKDVRTLSIYDDRRVDDAGTIAGLVSRAL